LAQGPFLVDARFASMVQESTQNQWSHQGQDSFKEGVELADSYTKGKCSQSSRPGTFGGQFPWAGCRYKVKVHSSASLLSWMNQALTVFLDQLIFAEDGTIRRKNGKPLTVCNCELRWRWDALGSKLMIEFLSGGRTLGKRWDELTPDREVNSVVSKWEGVAHVGASTYLFTLSLADPPLEQPQAWCESVLANKGSFVADDSSSDSEEPDEVPVVDIVNRIVAKYNGCKESDKESIDHILKIVDRMWLQELVLQSRAELLEILIVAAAEVEQLKAVSWELRSEWGPSEGEKLSIVTRILEEIPKVKALALDSLKVRSAARKTISLDGGLEGLNRTLAAQLDEVADGFRPLVDQLVQPTHADEVGKGAKRRLNNVLAELSALSDLKEANCDIFLQMEESLEDLLSSESAFTDTVLQAARANPQNADLQKTCAETLMCRPDATCCTTT